MKLLFTAGQRVAIKRGARHSGVASAVIVPIGTAGTVMATKDIPEGVAYHVLFDTAKSEHMTGMFSCSEHQLVPLYDGNQKISWSECAWVPSPIVTGRKQEMPS